MGFIGALGWNRRMPIIQVETPQGIQQIEIEGDSPNEEEQALIEQTFFQPREALTAEDMVDAAFETTERLLFSGMTDSGVLLDQEACEKLMSVEARGVPSVISLQPPAALVENSQCQLQAVTAELLEDNQRLFMEERDKLEKWADDKLLAAEEALKNTKAQLKQHKRDARKAITLQEQNAYQEKIAALERQQRQQRREIFNAEDEIIDKRDELIDSLQVRLKETTETELLFTLRWQVV